MVWTRLAGEFFTNIRRPAALLAAAGRKFPLPEDLDSLRGVFFLSSLRPF